LGIIDGRESGSIDDYVEALEGRHRCRFIGDV
jgi:hypothetical protein